MVSLTLRAFFFFSGKGPLVPHIWSIRDTHLHFIILIRIGGRSLGTFEESKALPETGSIE